MHHVEKLSRKTVDLKEALVFLGAVKQVEVPDLPFLKLLGVVEDRKTLFD